jgi:succinyl-CoA synthetase beta subunit
VDLHEYQGRSLFARHGLLVLDGGVATTPQEASKIAQRLGGRVVGKAQVKTGGRGKAGGVKLANTVEEAEAHARSILGINIKGHTVRRIMLTTTADIDEEYHFSYLLDRANRTFLCIASVAGGMEIEQVAQEYPERVAKVPIDAGLGVDEALARDIVSSGGFSAEVVDEVVAIAVKLWHVRRRGRHAGRGEPAGQDERRSRAVPGRQGDPRRKRRLPPATPASHPLIAAVCAHDPQGQP